MGRTRTSAAASLLLLAVVTGVPAPQARAAEASVTIRDNLFLPQELHVEPGDTVTWSSAGTRTHDVTSDTGAFVSGDIFRGGEFTHTFAKQGTYYYHCSFHGRPGKRGMWGVVVVGDPEPVDPSPGRPRIDVPADFKTIQGAVDAAEPGSSIFVAPGRYRGDVTIRTEDLVLRGVDRYRTILDGDGERGTGVLVEGAHDVKVANLTVRDFVTDGVAFEDAFRYTVTGVDAIGNGMHGVRATRSHEGVMRSSFAWGSGEAGFYVGDCMGCGALIEAVQARAGHAGIAAVDSTGVTIRGSTLAGNGVGIALTSTSDGAHAPGRGALVYDNFVRGDGGPALPPRRSGATFGIPRGTGIWLAGVANAVVRANLVHEHSRYGILVSALGDTLPLRNTVAANTVDGAGIGDLAWDGAGADNCFDGNELSGVPAPPDIERFTCDERPFTGEPYEPVIDDLAEALPASLALETADPGEPKRPRCQKGKPGCHSH